MRDLHHARLLLLFFLPCLIHAQQPAVEVAAPPLPGNLSPAWHNRCAEALRIPLPPEAFETGPTPWTAIARSNSISLLYGYEDQKIDLARARQLAWDERATILINGGGRNLSGPIVLAILYANGLGTPRNPALAMRMACEATAINGLGDAALDRLQSILDSPETPPPQFDLCVPTPSDAPSQQLCTAITTLRKGQQWSNEIDALGQSWPPDQRAALSKLKKSATEFFNTSSVYEWNTILHAQASSTQAIDPANFNSARQTLQQNLLAQLQGLESGKPLISTQLTPAEADTRLNKLYRAFDDRVRALPLDTNNLPSLINERSIEHLWLDYRDAFLALVKLRYPQSLAPWNAQLTADRTATLDKLNATLPPIDTDARPWIATCARYRKTPLPSELNVSARETTCDSYKSYYGLETPVDYARARNCAARERATIRKTGNTIPDDTAGISDSLSGPVILTMLYANGQGVPRNPAVALRMTCESIDNQQIGSPDVFASEDQNKTLIPALLKTVEDTANEKTTEPLDMCNYVPGVARLETMCDAITLTRDQLDREHDITSLSAKFTTAQRAAFQNLLDALRAYYKAHDAQETSVMGHLLDSGAWNGILSDREHLLIDDIHRFESGNLPTYTEAQYKSAERNHTAAFQYDVNEAAKDMTGIQKNFIGDHTAPTRPEDTNQLPEDLSPNALRATEQLWLAYRGAWVDFAHLRYAQVSRDSWLAWITLQHTHDLNDPCFFEVPCELEDKKASDSPH
jgi:hypothetical protein